MTGRDADQRLLRLNAALDGELDPMASLEFERELRDDPAFAAEYRRLKQLRDAIRRHAPRDAAPPALADRIAAMAGSAPLSEPAAAGSTVVQFQRRAWFDRRAFALAASLAVLGYALGAGLTSLRTASPSDAVAQGLVSDFTRASIVGQPFDVASSDRHTVKPWLAQHATLSAEIADLAQAGFTLEGGRIAVVDLIPAPTLVYRKREHLIALTELPLSAGARGDGPIETIDGFHVAHWSDANLNYVAVSDIDEMDLAAFAEAFRQAQKPAGEDKGR
jgi:anti-sigma factor RsiW